MRMPFQTWRTAPTLLLVLLAACSPDAITPPQMARAPQRLARDAVPPEAVFPDGELVSLTFFVNHADCSGLGSFTFSLNGVTLGTEASTSGCWCNDDELQVTFSGADAKAAWVAAAGGPNTIAVDVAQYGGTYIGYIRVRIETAHGTATARLFDALPGGNAEPRNLCDSYQAISHYARTFPPPGMTFPGGDLVSLTFVVNHADCSDGSQFEFLLNGATIGTHPTASACFCNSDEMQVSFDQAAAGDAWVPGGPNTLALRVSGWGVAVGYVRVGVQTTGGSAERALFDALNDGEGARRDLCQGFNWSEQWPDYTVSRTFTTPDATPPVIVPAVVGTLGSGDWYTSDVAVTWAVTDDESAITGTSGCDPVSITQDQSAVTYTCSATSTGGTASQSVTVKRDATAPTIGYSGNAGTYTVDEALHILCAADDVLSGLASTTCADLTGDAYLFGPGSHTASATATDNAGNTASATTTFTITATSASVCTLVRRWVPQAGVANSLCQKLDAAGAAAARGNQQAKAGVIGAFTHEVGAQSGKAIPADKAAVLVTLARVL